jgi:hypothetical protein
MEKKQMGVWVNGLVISKNEYIPQRGDARYTLDIAVPGNRHNIPVQVDRQVFDKQTELQPFTCKVTVTSFNNNIYFIMDSETK